MICFKCGKKGHYSRDYKQDAQGVRIYFHRKQMGHIKTNCPLMNPKVAIHALTPATLRITDEQQGIIEAPRAKGKAFQFMEEEAREAL